MVTKNTEFEQQMTQLEAEIKRLEAEYNMFFAGRLPRLPWETRARVEALVKRYDRMQLRNTAERFRFGSLQARYVTFTDLWERSLRAREEGRPQRGPRTGAPAARAVAPPPPAGPRAGGPPAARVVAVAAFRDPSTETERLADLYEQLSAARKQAGEKPVAFDAFKQVVRAQVSKLGGGQSEVAFRIAVVNGKVTMKATAVNSDE